MNNSLMFIFLQMTTELEEPVQKTRQNKSGIELELEAGNQEHDDNGRTSTKKINVSV